MADQYRFGSTDKEEKCRVFIRVITPTGYTVDLLGECDAVEIENQFTHITRPPYRLNETVQGKLLPTLDVLAYRIAEGHGEDRHLIGDQLPSKDDLIFGVGHRA